MNNQYESKYQGSYQRKGENKYQKKNRFYDAVQAMVGRGLKSITLEMIGDEVCFSEGYPNSRSPEAKQLTRGLGNILNEMVNDGTLYTTNKNTSYHITGMSTNITNNKKVAE